ncbi:MAG: ferritin-like domain-containing protein [Bauldia sp.]
MALFGKEIETMHDLFTHLMRDMYYAEKQIEKALPDMVEKATSQELKAAFSDHLQQTHEHVARLERAFELHGQKAKAIDCPAIDGILKEAKDVAADIADKRVLDAGLIAMAQAVEHYEMARYGTLVAWGKELGHREIVELLSKTLEEEHEADEKLTDLAEGSVNVAAAEGAHRAAAE